MKMRIGGNWGLILDSIFPISFIKYNMDGYRGVSLISPLFNNFDSNHFEIKMPPSLLETRVIRNKKI